HETQVVRTEHEVDLPEAAQDRVALLLRDAARDADQPARSLVLPCAQRAEVVVEALLRLVADRARVDHEQIGVELPPRVSVAGVMEQVRDLLRVVRVHLASVRPDVEARRVAARQEAEVQAAQPNGARHRGAIERTEVEYWMHIFGAYH